MNFVVVSEVIIAAFGFLVMFIQLYVGNRFMVISLMHLKSTTLLPR